MIGERPALKWFNAFRYPSDLTDAETFPTHPFPLK